jgi:hypothetical protein
MSLVNQRSDAQSVIALQQIQTQNDIALSTAINTGASISVNTTTNLEIRDDLSNTIIPLMIDICNGIGLIDLSVSFVETNQILTDICNGIGLIDLSVSFVETNQILTDICNGIGAIDLSVSFVETNQILTDICSGQDIGNMSLNNIDDYLQPKGFSVFGSSSLSQNVPPLPFSGNFVNVPCVWKKLVCETSQVNPFASGVGGIGSVFYDTSGTPVGTEPVLLRLTHPAVNQHYAGSGFVGTSFHDITFPDGGLICNHGIGVICSPQSLTYFINNSITGYYTT